MPKWHDYTIVIENTLDFQRRRKTFRAISRRDAEYVISNRCKRNPLDNIVPDGWRIVSLDQTVPVLIHTPAPFNKEA